MEIYGTDLGFWDKAHRTQDWIWRFKRTEQNDADSAVVRRKRWWWWWRRRWKERFFWYLSVSLVFLFSLSYVSLCVSFCIQLSEPQVLGSNLSPFFFLYYQILIKKLNCFSFFPFFFLFPFFLNKFFISCVLRI